jgi:3-dehydroquinate synthase
MDVGDRSTDCETVRVELGPRSYDILIGPNLIGRAGDEIARKLPGARAVIVTDRNVAALYLEALSATLSTAGIESVSHIVEPGESSKSFPVLEDVVDAILAARLERGDVVIALGGGVVGDLAGFASGIARRGMNLVQVPTSLLAQVDSSVGGKTGINTPRGKNLVGVFFQPKLVLADTSVLDTLTERHFRAGYAEVAKYGLLGGAPFFRWLDQNWREIFAGGQARRRAIATSCAAKAAVVATDETEAGSRALLNLGHTFGHALEAATGYSDRLIHGEAISIGMVLAARYSAETNLCPTEVPAKVQEHFSSVGLPTELRQVPGAKIPSAQLMELIGQDKKVSRGRLTFILMRGIGEAFIANDVDPASVSEFIERQQQT